MIQVDSETITSSDGTVNVTMNVDYGFITLKEFKAFMEGFMAAKKGQVLTEDDIQIITSKMNLVQAETITVPSGPTPYTPYSPPISPSNPVYPNYPWSPTIYCDGSQVNPDDTVFIC